MRTEVTATVTICQACGDPGFLRALLICFKCKISVEHRYCQINQKKSFGEISKWLCELCKSKISQRYLSNLAIKRSLQVARLKTHKIHGGFRISAVAIKRFLSIQSWNSNIQNSRMAVGAKNSLDICELEAGTVAVEEVLGDSVPQVEILGRSSTGLFSKSKPAIGDGTLDGKISLGRKRKLNAEEAEDRELHEEASELVTSVKSNNQCANGRKFNKIHNFLPLDYGAGRGSCKKADRTTTGVVSEYCNDLVRECGKSQNKIDSRIMEPTDDLKMALLEAHNDHAIKTSTIFTCKYPVPKEMEVAKSVDLHREKKVQNARMRLPNGDCNGYYGSNACKYTGKGKSHQTSLPDNEQKAPNSNVAQEYDSRPDSSPEKNKDIHGTKLVIDKSSDGNIVSTDKVSVLPSDPPNALVVKMDDSQLLPTNPSGEKCVAPLVHPVWRGCFAIASGTGPIMCHPVKALLSDIACKIEKVCEESRMIPTTLNLEMCSRLKSWPNSFVSSKPTANSIALYFIPEDDRAGPVYDELLMKAVKRDCIFHTTLEAVELLLIPSLHLPAEFHRLQGKLYLWGLFKSKQIPIAINCYGKVYTDGRLVPKASPGSLYLASRVLPYLCSGCITLKLFHELRHFPLFKTVVGVRE